MFRLSPIVLFVFFCFVYRRSSFYTATIMNTGFSEVLHGGCVSGDLFKSRTPGNQHKAVELSEDKYLAVSLVELLRRHQFLIQAGLLVIQSEDGRAVLAFRRFKDSLHKTFGKEGKADWKGAVLKKLGEQQYPQTFGRSLTNAKKGSSGSEFILQKFSVAEQAACSASYDTWKEFPTQTAAAGASVSRTSFYASSAGEQYHWAAGSAVPKTTAAAEMGMTKHPRAITAYPIPLEFALASRGVW